MDHMLVQYIEHTTILDFHGIASVAHTAKAIAKLNNRASS